MFKWRYLWTRVQFPPPPPDKTADSDRKICFFYLKFLDFKVF